MFGSLENGLASTNIDLDCMLLLRQDEIRYHVSLLIMIIMIRSVLIIIIFYIRKVSESP